MKLSRLNLIIAKLADKKDAELNQLQIDPDGSTIAANGLSMVAVSPVENVPKFFPEIDGECDAPEEGIGISPESATEILRNMPRTKGLGFAAITEVSETRVNATTTDMSVERVTKCRVARKRFPEWKHVLREKRAACKHKVCVSRKAMLALLQVMESACVDPDSLAFLEFGDDPNGGMVVRSMSVDTRQQVIGYVTAVDTEGEWMLDSAWERKVCRRPVKKRKL